MRRFFIVLCLVFIVSGCTREDQDTGEISVEDSEIIFSCKIVSPVENVKIKTITGSDFKTSFEDGDEVGLYAVRRATTNNTATLASSGNYIHNVKLTYHSTDGGKWVVDATTPIYYAGGGYVLDFYAYYPYSSSASNPTAITFNVQTDQSTTTNYGKSDLLLSNTATGITKGGTVNLIFSHALSLVEVTVSPGTIKGNGPANELALSLRGCKKGGALNLSSGFNTDVSAEAQAVKMLRVENDLLSATSYTYRALVPAQTVAEGTSLCLMNQNGQFYPTPPLVSEEDRKFKAAKVTRYTAALPATAIATVKIPAGSFVMGSSDGTNIGTGLNTTPVEPNRESNETQHKVTLTKGFYMSKYQITNAQYAAFLNAKGIGNNGQGSVTYYKDNFTTPVTENQTFITGDNWGVQWNNTESKWFPAMGKDNYPVINVTWYGAKAYADWLGGSLPTEAQWEYACRAGEANRPFGVGAGYALDNSNANFNWQYSWSWDGSNQNAIIGSSGNYPGNTQAVGIYSPNNYGLYDMHGNVFEWCSDWYNANYGSTNASDAATDPKGSTTGEYRVLRGGSWYAHAQYCRSSFRFAFEPNNADNSMGFRVVLAP